MKIAGVVSSIVLMCVVTVLCGLRWGVTDGLGPAGQYAMPLLPIVPVLVISFRAPTAVPSWLVFVCGLVMDLLLQGPLGFWSLIYLVGLLAVRIVPSDHQRSWIMRLGWMTAICAALVALQWIAASSYLWAGVEVWPLVRAGGIVWLCTVAVEIVVAVVGRLEMRVDESIRLMRGSD